MIRSYNPTIQTYCLRRKAKRLSSERNSDDEGGRLPKPTREAILAAAQELFAECGYDGTSIRDIGKKAGVGHAAVTYHFGNKEQVWKTAIRKMIDPYYEELRIKGDLIRDLPPDQKNRQMLVMFIRCAASQPFMNRVIVQESYKRSWRLEWISEKLFRPVLALNQSILGEGIGELMDKDPVFTFALIGACTHIFSVAGQAEEMYGLDVFSEEVIQHHVEVILAFFTPG